MKYIKPYNESIKDFLKPKSEEEILKSTASLEPLKKLEVGKRYNYQKLIDLGKQELLKNTELLKKIKVEQKFYLGRYYDIPELSKIAEQEVIDDINSSKPIDKIKKGTDYGLLWAVKDGVRDLPNRKYSFKDVLYTATHESQLEIVQYLIDNVTLRIEDINHVLNIGFERYAERSDDNGRLEKTKTIIKLLKNKKLELLKNVTDYNKLLKFGCESNNFEMVKKAIDNGADVNKQYESYLNTAIHLKNINIVKILIDNGARGGHIGPAIKSNNIEMVKLLQQHGFTIDRDNYYNLESDILDWIKDGTHHEMIKYLITQKPDLKTPIQNKINQLNNLISKNKKYLE